MVGWHHQLNGHGFEWALGVSDGQGGQACCSSWDRKELDMTEQQFHFHTLTKSGNTDINKMGYSKIKSFCLLAYHQSILEEISPEYSLKGLMLKLKLQYFSHIK